MPFSTRSGTSVTVPGGYVIVLTVTDADGYTRSHQQLVEMGDGGLVDPTGSLVVAIIIATGGLGTAAVALALIIKPNPRK